MNIYATLLMIGASATACDKGSEPGTTHTTGSTASVPKSTQTSARDESAPVGPKDQGKSPADINTTRAIREALMADGTLSNDARNVDIVTVNGVITLRGPVRTNLEKTAVEVNASALAGSNSVDDQLYIATK